MSAPELSGLHHIAIFTSDIEEGTRWYSAVLSAKRLSQLDHHGTDGTGPLVATILLVPGMPGTLQIRRGELPAEYDPLTLEVADEAALDDWIRHLDGIGVPHSGVVQKRTGKALEVPTPDGQILRFYTAPANGFENARLLLP